MKRGKKVSKKRNRKAQDLTLINLDAIRKRLDALESGLDIHDSLIDDMRLDLLVAKIRPINKKR